MDLQDKHVVVTGASRGIGEALAQRLAGAGARVSLVARTKSTLDSLAQRLGGLAFACDLSRKEELEGLVGRIEEKGGPIDVLINNAGVEASKRLEDSTAEELAQVLFVNLNVPAELSRQVLPGMIARGRGHIVNISSLAGVVAFPGFASYGASKAGLSHFTACMQGDLEGTGVNTTLVELGPVPTDMFSSVKHHPPTEAAFARTERLLLVRQVPREEVAAKIVRALQKDQRRLCLPARGMPFTALTDLPRKVIKWILSDIPRR